MPTPSMRHEPGAAPHFARIQRWMQACMFAGGPAEAAIASPAAAKEFPVSKAPGLIRPTRTLAPLERLDIYRGMYELRLVEALRVDYPGLVRFLGDDTFSELARMYVAAHPSQSYTLNRLGDHLPEYLARVDGLPKPRFVFDLARLELAETFVFDEAESPIASSESVARLDEAHWGRLRLRPIQALRLIELHYPAHLYLEAIRKDQPLPALRPRRTRLIVYRRDFGLSHMALSSPAFALFSALTEGMPLGEAVERMFLAGGAPGKAVFQWFRHWFSERLFQSVEIC